jgi:hypothetical protein
MYAHVTSNDNGVLEMRFVPAVQTISLCRIFKGETGSFPVPVPSQRVHVAEIPGLEPGDRIIVSSMPNGRASRLISTEKERIYTVSRLLQCM